MHPFDEQSVFLVDDDADGRESLVSLVRSMGYSCTSYESGEAFLESSDGLRPGCAIVDFHLPGLNGVQVHQRLVGIGSSIPVILMSGLLTVREAVAALGQGVFRVLEKPYTDEDLEGAIAAALQWDHSYRKARRYRLDAQHRLDSLQTRERITLALILAGQPNKVIERRLGLSRRTVERIRTGILEKMGTLSFVELAARLAENQLRVEDPVEDFTSGRPTEA